MIIDSCDPILKLMWQFLESRITLQYTCNHSIETAQHEYGQDNEGDAACCCTHRSLMECILPGSCGVILRPRQNGHHFPDDFFKCIFLNENIWILIKISLKFVSKGPINNISALVYIMAWRRPGDKPFFEPKMVRLPTHICVTRPQCVNKSPNGRAALIEFCAAMGCKACVSIKLH